MLWTILRHAASNRRSQQRQSALRSLELKHTIRSLGNIRTRSTKEEGFDWCNLDTDWIQIESERVNPGFWLIKTSARWHPISAVKKDFRKTIITRDLRSMFHLWFSLPNFHWTWSSCFYCWLIQSITTSYSFGFVKLYSWNLLIFAIVVTNKCSFTWYTESKFISFGRR